MSRTKQNGISHRRTRAGAGGDNLPGIVNMTYRDNVPVPFDQAIEVVDPSTKVNEPASYSQEGERWKNCGIGIPQKVPDDRAAVINRYTFAAQKALDRAKIYEMPADVKDRGRRRRADQFSGNPTVIVSRSRSEVATLGTSKSAHFTVSVEKSIIALQGLGKPRYFCGSSNNLTGRIYTESIAKSAS